MKVSELMAVLAMMPDDANVQIRAQDDWKPFVDEVGCVYVDERDGAVMLDATCSSPPTPKKA